MAVREQDSPELRAYIGDGVYVEWVNRGIDVRVNDHRNPVAVVLEPEVLKRLVDFYQRMTGEKLDV